MIPKYFSYSGIKSFNQCPAKFKYRYVDKIFKKDEGIEAFMGKRVHEAIEYLYNEKKDGKLLSLDSLIEYYSLLWDRNWHNRIAIVNKRILPIERNKNMPIWKKYAAFYYRTGEECLTRFYSMNKPFEHNVYANEYEIDFFIDGNKKYRIKGIIDRLDVDKKGNWIIHDYKTGKRIYTQKEANKDIQLGLYQMGLENKNQNINSITLVWHFLQQPKERIVIQSKRNIMEIEKLKIKVKKTIDTIINMIENNKKFETKKAMLCNWCYYWEECPSQKISNPNIGVNIV